MAKNKWYGCRDNNGPIGVFDNWDEAQAKSSGCPGERHQGFKTYPEAWAFAYGGSIDDAPAVPAQPVAAPEPAKPAAIPEFMAPVRPAAASGPEKSAMPKPAEPVRPAVTGSVRTAPAGPVPQSPRQLNTPAAPKPAPSREAPALPRLGKAAPETDVGAYCAGHGFDHLSAEQRRAVEAVDGKYLLVAVPGSGKTTVLMARAGYMVHACHIPAGRMMNMTFTRAAAHEMRDRYKKFFPDDAAVPDFRTIHSFCWSIVLKRLKEFGFVYPSHFINGDMDVRADEEEEKRGRSGYSQINILAEVLRSCKGLNRLAYDETAQTALQTAFTAIKNNRLTPEEYSRYTVFINRMEYPVAPFYDKYQALLSERDCMDFDDMLTLSVQGLKEYPQVLEELRSQYCYWSIDEAQDNSLIQHELMDLLAGDDGNLFMVGDDDQSIYSFRGAKPSRLLEYGNRADVTTLEMGINYRSAADIVCASREFIEAYGGKNRFPKQLRAHRQEHGTVIVPDSFRSEAAQYEYIETVAGECAREGKTLGVLYQLNASALPLVVRLHRAGIPFEASRGLKKLLDRGMTGSMMRILRFAEEPCDPDRFFACFRDMELYFAQSKNADMIRERHAAQTDVPILQILRQITAEYEKTEPKKAQDRMAQIDLWLERLPRLMNADPGELPGMLGFAGETVSQRLELYGLVSVCDLYDTVPEMLDAFDDMCRAEREAEKKRESARENGSAGPVERPWVSLSTIHSAKGREWDRVLLIDSLQEAFPGMDRGVRLGYDPGEAPRVFYVAVTRAKTVLELLTVNLYHGNPESASCFIGAFALGADAVLEMAVETRTDDVPWELKSTPVAMRQMKYYGVRAGREKGVYTDWETAQRQTDGYSGAEYKSFDCYEDAWKYAFPDEAMPEPKKPLLCGSIREHIQQSRGALFNYPMELPDFVSRTLLAHLGAESIGELPEEQMERLANESRLFVNGARTDYRGRTDGYAAVYMPVNFYKLWLPLWRLLEKDELPEIARVLELGPGPGTSTWSLLYFYMLLARENPDRAFELNYTAVELETGFRPVFEAIHASARGALPGNLKLTLALLSPEDAYRYIAGQKERAFDLVIESNMINLQENVTRDNIRMYLEGLAASLRGCAILIEPREKARPGTLERLAERAEADYSIVPHMGPEVSAVGMGGIAMVRDSIARSLRYTNRTEHGFSWAVLRRRDAS